MLKIIFFLFGLINTNSQFLPGSQVDPSGHNCVVDGGYQWCEDTQLCIRTWETECNSLNTNDPLTCQRPCPPPSPCPMPDISDIDINNCIISTNTDDCGCEISCPSYNCNLKQCMFNSDCRNNQKCIRDTQRRFFKCVDNPIPENCATWNDGCNTCQVNNGVAEICTMMYCITQNTPYCMNYHIQQNSLQIGDICYRFCEDNSQENINKRSDCPTNSKCIQNSDIISYDNCNNFMTCQINNH
tara:strand:- start:96 stop:821 length:726 start_codon:yes stop_codon:yes gene_type:complete